MENAEFIVQLQTEIEQLKQTIYCLKEQIEWFNRQLFGKRSEKIIPINDKQCELPGFETFHFEKNEHVQTIEKHQRKKASRQGQDKITLPENLPVERVVLDIPEEEKVCKETGVSLTKIGEEISHKLAHKPGSYYIKEIVRPKYANPKKCEEGIKTANLPDSLLNRCQADNSFLADILVKKYCDHLPLYRISEILSRENINISRQLLSQWVIKSGEALKPLYMVMQQKIIESGVLFVDETPVKMLDPGAGKTKLAYMWVLCGGNPAYRTYHFRDNRKHHNAEEILKGFSGILHSDKYGAYETLAQKKQFTWCPCWVHIRRKFFEANHGDKEFQEMILTKIVDIEIEIKNLFQ